MIKIRIKFLTILFEIFLLLFLIFYNISCFKKTNLTNQEHQLIQIGSYKYSILDLSKQSKKALKVLHSYNSVHFPLRGGTLIKTGDFLLLKNRYTNEFFCINITSNSLIWRNKEYSLDHGSKVIGSVFICLNTAKKVFVSVDIATGVEHRLFPIPNISQESIGQFTLLDGNDNNLIFINLAVMKASIFGFDFKTGIKKWEYLENLSSETNFTFNSDKVIFVDTQGRLLAINRESGKIDWINKEIRWNQAILYIPVSANQFFLYNDTENVTGNFFALINIDTGKFIKKELVMLNNTDQMMLIRSMLGVNPQDQTRYFFLFSSNNQYFLSLWDLDDMKEIWRLSLGKWDNYIDLESFLEIKFDPSIPENVILSCKRNTLNAIDPTPKEEDQILDGEYLIDMTSGKIVFQFLVPTIDPIKNESKLYELDYKNHCIKWAIIIKGAEVEERSEAYSKSRIFLLKRWTENEKIIEDGFLELNPQNGNILAYYPKNKDEEKMYYCFSINQFRFFYSNEEDSLLQMQTDY